MHALMNLSDAPRGGGMVNAGIEVHNLSWWFWIKAGMGFTFGACIVTTVGFLLYWLFLLNVLLGVTRLLQH